MPVALNPLETAIADAFKLQGSPKEAADAIAQAYADYAGTGLATPGIPVFTGKEKDIYAATIETSISDSNAGTPINFATALGNGMLAFWLVPPIIFGPPPIVGAVTSVPGISVAISVIATALSNIENTEDQIAQQIATALDSATKTVLVTFTGPPPPIGPPPPATVI